VIRLSTRITTDADGKVKIGFNSYATNGWTMHPTSNLIKYPSNAQYLGWGIDNINIREAAQPKKIPYMCAKSGQGVKSQLYCWGHVGRSLPILNTSLYNTEKISSINKLFVTSLADVKNQMAYDNYNDEGNLFLKYPTYIGGFDYPFYFK
jgi:hypothetical protein